MIETPRDVDNFINQLTRVNFFRFNSYYNCSHVSPKWTADNIAGNLTVICRAPSFIPIFPVENGLLLAILKYVMCNLNLEIILKPSLVMKVTDTTENVLTIPPWFLFLSESNNYDNIVYSEIFQIDILTTKKITEDLSVMSFIRIFDNWVWIALLMSFLSVMVICKQLMSDMSYVKLFRELYCQLLAQNSDDFQELRKLLKYSTIKTKTILIVLTSIWILMATILSKAFSEGLLSTYFGRESRPMIGSMDDVLNRKGFKVVIQQRDREKFRQFMPEVFNKLYTMERVEWVPTVQDNSTAQLINQVSNGRKVLLVSSFTTEQFIQEHIDLPLVVGNRYSMNYLVTAISRRHPFGKKIRDAIVWLTVAGINIRTKNVIELIRHMKGRLALAQRIDGQQSKEPSDEHQIDINHTVKSWTPILAFGTILSLLLFIWERFHFWTRVK